MKPPINQQIIQGRYFMSCFLYSHSEREHKSYQKVPAPATFGPPLRLFCTTHLLPELPACMLALGGDRLGAAFRILLPRETKYPPSHEEWHFLAMEEEPEGCQA